MIKIGDFISQFPAYLAHLKQIQPWDIPSHLSDTIFELILKLDMDFTITDDVAIHRDAVVEKGAIIKAPAVICSGCFIGAHAYLRGGCFLGENVVVGPSCEVKTSLVFNNSSIAHFNFIGDSIIGSNVNFEAGAVIANHYNERGDKRISVLSGNKIIVTQVEKFGALVGDRSRVGANAVLSPGTLLLPEAIVKRLELVEQIK